MFSVHVDLWLVVCMCMPTWWGNICSTAQIGVILYNLSTHKTDSDSNYQ